MLLRVLKNLRVPPSCRAEIIVIDNNSVDNTKNVVDYYSRSSSIAILDFLDDNKAYPLREIAPLEKLVVITLAFWMMNVLCGLIGWRL